jgi:hypothetical protein
MAHDRTNEGADVFWPGYVDAVTNLVLNLLFLLTVMTVAVFMFAMELGRQHVSTNAPRSDVSSGQEIKRSAAEEVADLNRQIEELKREVQLAKAESVQPLKVLPASQAMKNPDKSIERATPVTGGLIVRYTDEAVALTAAEADKLRISLGPIVSSGKARIEVVVPAGFSEAKRLGFYRAMSVRNLLIEMKMPPERIDVSVREGRSGADAALVRVMPH